MLAAICERTSLDSVGHGLLSLEQPVSGYRYNVDSLILAHFAATSPLAPPATVIDLGAGCGVVGLLLAKRWPKARIHLVENQHRLAALSRRNVQRNNLSGRVRVEEADLRSWSSRQRSMDPPLLVVCNPPFFKSAEGRPSHHPEIAAAKHEISCTLRELLTSCKTLLAQGACLTLIQEARRERELFQELSSAGLRVNRRRWVKPLPDRSPNRVLVAIKASGSLSFVDQQALVIHSDVGVYSAEMQQILRGR